MKTASFEELQVGMIIVMAKAGPEFPGLAGRLFKVIAINDPYIAIETGTRASTSRHMINGREAEFTKPSDEMVAAMLPDRGLNRSANTPQETPRDE